jgi:hypothetical protein
MPDGRFWAVQRRSSLNVQRLTVDSRTTIHTGRLIFY